MQHSCSFVITESSQVGAARRGTVALAVLLGFNDTKQGEIALIVTELATNLLYHAVHGELFMRAIAAQDAVGIEIVAVDKGPGMANVSQCLRDGYSTAGTSGNGLGAIARLSHTLEIYSLPAGGTILLTRLWAKPVSFLPPPVSLEHGVINRPKPDQEVCGDSWAVAHLPERSLFFLADGLGHGPDAALASHEAVDAFQKHTAKRPKEILEAVHAALSGTRGAAAAVAEVNFAKQEVCYAGIGNIVGTVVLPEQHYHMVSHNGIVGHDVRKVQEFSYKWEPHGLLVLHSDGLSSRWQIDRYPGLIVRHPGLIAGVLYRDFQRDTDDATVLVACAFGGSKTV